MGTNLADAIGDALRGAGWNPSGKGRLLMSVADSHKAEIMPVASQFIALGWKISATTGITACLKQWGMDVPAC